MKSLTQAQMKIKAKKRPANFEELSPAEQWEVDKKLGILDWKGEIRLPQPAKVNYNSVRESMSRWFRLVLTDKQIDRFVKVIPDAKVRRDIRTGCFDTYEREFLIDAVIHTIMGPDDQWPINCQIGSDYDKQFWPRFFKACKREGIKIRKG